MRTILVFAAITGSCFAQIPDDVRSEQREIVQAAKESKLFSAKRYDALIERIGAITDADGARALFRDLVQLAYDHETGDEYIIQLCGTLERADMRAVGWEALPEEIELERLTLADGRVLVGTGGLLAARHPELEAKALAGQRLMSPNVGLTGIGNFWVAREQVKKADRVKVKRPRAFLVSERGRRVVDGRLVVEGDWLRPGEGTRVEAIALDLVDAGNGGALFANEELGLRTAWRTAEARGLDVREEWREELGWNDGGKPPEEAAPGEGPHEELRKKAPGVEWPEPFDVEPAVKLAVEKLDVKLEGDAEADLLRLRFAYTYGGRPPALALDDPRKFRQLENAVHAFLRGGPIEDVLKTGADFATVAAAVRFAPDFDAPPEPGLDADGVWIRFPKAYGPWRRRPLLLVLHGQYRVPEYDFGLWTALPGARDFVVAAPTYGSTAGTARSPAADDEILRVVRRLSLTRNVDPDRIFVTGISMGGALTWRLIQSYPSRWAAAGPEIHGPKEYAGKFGQLRNVAGLPIYLMEGEFDGLNTLYSRAAVPQLRGWNAPITHIEARNYGHDRLVWLYPRFLKWLEGRRREAHPVRVEHWAMNAFEGESSWLAIRAAKGAAAFKMKDGAFNPNDLCGVEAIYENGVITLKTLGGRPSEIEIFFDPAIMGSAIEVRSASKTLIWKPVGSVRFMLERVRETGDREQVFADSVRVGL
ncbi:MAG: hypothetical protein HYY18_20400 [Planctomycetes bacterium]|nr:hypothetical protein [Planctomycetota bacterium]